MVSEREAENVMDPAHKSLLQSERIATFENAVRVTVGLRGAPIQGALITEQVHINIHNGELDTPKMAANMKVTPLRARSN